MAQFNLGNTVILVVSCRSQAEETIFQQIEHEGREWDHVLFTDNNFIINNYGDNNFSFILANQDRWQVVKDNIFTRLNNKYLMVWSHNNGGPECDQIGYAKLLRCRRFSHTYDSNITGSGDEIEQFMIRIGKERDVFKDKADIIIAKNVEYHSLRAEVLTPLIPIHFALQEGTADRWNDLLKNAKRVFASTEIEETLSNLLDLRCIAEGNEHYLKGIGNEHRDELLRKFRAIREKSAGNELQVSEIEEFGDCLENLINFIEFGEKIQCI